MNWFALGGAIGVFIVGGGAGYAVREEIGQRRIANCAKSVLDQSLTNCPVPIVTAFAAVKEKLKTTEIEYREGTIKVITGDQAQTARIAAQQAADMVALGQQERTNACADSPAFRLRREQLLRDLAPEAAADGQADTAPR